MEEKLAYALELFKKFFDFFGQCDLTLKVVRRYAVFHLLCTKYLFRFYSLLD
jgi:hypothetical protein